MKRNMSLTLLPAILAVSLCAGRAEAQMTAVNEFGSNPGALNMYRYVPDDMPAEAPLVVVLHGCSQSASSMLTAGWNQLADTFNFYVVYAEQRSANNPMTCFNWAGEYGDPANMERGSGENESIAEMVDKMKVDYSIDADRVSVAGFSAGAAFAAVMLATWPDVFSAGAIMSGIPYRCAYDVDSAYDCQQMNANPTRKKSPAEWGDLVRDAYPGYSGPYPRVSIWHGNADTYIVHYDNLTELVEQWTNVHGIDQTPTATEDLGGHQHQRFDQDGQTVVESYLVSGMGHAVALGADEPDHPCAAAGYAAYFTDVGLCSTYRVAEFLGLTGTGDGPDDPPVEDDHTAPTVDITAPIAGATVTGSTTVLATASDDVALDRVEFYVDGALQVTDRGAPYQFDWATGGYAAGDHDLMAIAYDTAGNLGVDDDTRVTVTRSGGGGADDDDVVEEFGPLCAVSLGGRATGAEPLLLVLVALGLTWFRSRRRRSPRHHRR